MSQSIMSVKLKVATYVLQQIKLHGLPFIMIGFMTWFFFSELKEVKADFKECNESIIQLYDSNQTKLIEAIERNTVALENCK